MVLAATQMIRVAWNFFMPPFSAVVHALAFHSAPRGRISHARASRACRKWSRVRLVSGFRFTEIAALLKRLAQDAPRRLQAAALLARGRPGGSRASTRWKRHDASGSNARLNRTPERDQRVPEMRCGRTGRLTWAALTGAAATRGKAEGARSSNGRKNA